jgi:hypothetical protein
LWRFQIVDRGDVRAFADGRSWIGAARVQTKIQHVSFRNDQFLPAEWRVDDIVAG